MTLKQLLNEKRPVEVMEAHSGLSAKLVDASKFDAIWESSLTDSAIKGLPDTELVSEDSRLNTIREIKRASNKPIIVDWDTGGQLEHIAHWVQELEREGVSAIVIEDKQFPKKNSLLENTEHTLEDVDVFCQKIKRAKEIAKDIMIVARIESLIAKRSLYDALLRAEAYVDCGADAILIHSKEQVSATEVMKFAERFKQEYKIPLIAIPTTYTLPEDHPFDIVIHANQMLRASLKAMQDLLNDKAELASVQDIFNIVGK
jgi:phosphoenolpyruvate mutase